MKLIKVISRILSKLEGSLVVLLLGFMIVLAFLQVILRNLFATGFLWGDPFLRHLVLWIGFLGASLATQQEKHINLDLVTRFASPKFVNLTRILTNLFACTVTTFLAHAGWVFLQSEIETGELLFTIDQANFPAWWFQLIIPIGFGLMAFRFLIRTIEHIIEALRPPQDTNPPNSVSSTSA